MAKAGTAYIDVKGDFSHFNRQLRNEGRGAGRRMSAAAKGGMVSAGAALGAGLAVGLRKAFNEAVEAKKITAQTNAVLKSTGEAANVTAKEVEKLSTALSNKAGIDDEVIQKGANLLLTFTNIRNEAGKGNDVFNRATTAITDMSVALDQDMKSSAIQLGKALNDPVKGMTALQRVGVSFTAEQKEMVKGWVESGDSLRAQKFILKELNTEFGGSAAAQATAFDRFKVTTDNLAESLGTALLPSLEKAAGGLADLIDGMRSGEGVGGGVSRVVSSIKREINGFVRAMGLSKADLRQFGQAMTNVFNALKPVISSAIKGWQSNFKGFARAVGGMVKLISGILTGDFGKAWQGVKQIFSGGIKAAGGIIRAATAPLRHAAKAAFGVVANAASSAWRAAKNAIGGFINDIIGLINKIPGVKIGKINTSKGMSKGGSGGGGGGGFARGGYLAGAGLHDTVPILAAPGEAILNRHQQGPVEHALLSTYGFGLDDLFSRVNKPHYMARGGRVQNFALGGLVGRLPGASSLGFAGSMGDVMMGLTEWVVTKASSWMKEKIASILESRRSSGSANGLVPQVKRALTFAKGHGWSGSVVSGFRSAAEQESLYQRYLNGTGNLAAPPGNSSHEKGEAVDVSATEPFAAAMASAPANSRLYRRVPGEPWHFSVSGHNRGGWIAAAKGKAPSKAIRRQTHRAVDKFRKRNEMADALAAAGLGPSADLARRLKRVDQLLKKKGLSREDRMDLLRVRAEIVGETGGGGDESVSTSESSSDNTADQLATAIAANTKALEDHTKEIQKVSASNSFQFARAFQDIIDRQLAGNWGGVIAVQAQRPVTA